MKVQLPEWAEVLWDRAARNIVLWGGRGAGKSRSVASALIIRAMQQPERVLCCREVQRSIKDSVKRLLDDEIDRLGASDFFTTTDTEIRGKNGSLFIFAGLRMNVASVKSLEGITIAWIEEAQSVSQASLDVLTPTIRQDGSQLIWTYNPAFDTDPVDAMFRGANGPPPRSVVREVQADDNPWFPAELAEVMEFDRRTDPNKYQHVWRGGYVTAVEGAYYANQLGDARREGRVGAITADPYLQRRAFWDIGTNDSTAIWVAQFVGERVLVLDYYEASGQPLGAHLDWLRNRHGQGTLCVLPHDGANVNHITASRFSDHVRAAGFDTVVVKNQGKGAAMQRVEALRALFSRLWFEEDKCRSGLKALAAYSPKIDPNRRTDLGPLHNWASHGADAAGLMAVAYTEPTSTYDDYEEPDHETGRSRSTGY